jgi:predicted dehydrogenase
LRTTGRKLRAGVIGTGMGRYHMEGYAKHPRSQLFAVCDLNQEEARAFATQYGAKHVFADYHQMLAMEELDLVSIAAPNYLHAPMTLEALRAGKDVLCEKPMALSARDAEAMVQEARRRQRRLMINVGMRFNPVHRGLRDRVTAGDLGRVYYAKSYWIRRKGMPVVDFPQTGSMGRGDWFVQKSKSGGGALIDIGIHMFDLVWWLMGSPRPTHVLASAYAELLPSRMAAAGVKGDVDDLASALVKFDTGQTLSLEVSWDAFQEPNLGYQLFGTTGGARWGNWAKSLTLFSDSRGKAASKEFSPKKKVPSSYHHFVDACLDRDLPLIASGEEILHVARVLDAVYASQKTGKAVAL